MIALSLTPTANAEPDQKLDTFLFSSSVAPGSEYSENDLETARAFAVKVIQLLDQDWSAWFREQGLEEPRVGYLMMLPGDAFVSQCLNADGMPVVIDGNTQNALYCSADAVVEGYQGTIIVPVLAMRRIWDGDLYGQTVSNPGDFTVATILAHEFSHHIVDELVVQGVYTQQPTSVKNQELIADCLAGNWVASAYGHGQLGDNPEASLKQAVEALETAGDYEIASPDHHGTPSERSTALRIGLYGTSENPQPGNPQNCFVTYWK